MKEKILNFIKYNNIFTLGVMFFFLVSGVSFAASPDLREGVYASSEELTSIDNGILLGTNLDSFNFSLRINSVKEDNKSYYVDYSYQTLAIEDGSWQKLQRTKSMTVSKSSIEGHDLGLYVAGQLSDNIRYELSVLKETKEMQIGQGTTPKVVTTTYSGLIGRMVDPKQKVVQGYNPVIPEAVAAVAVAESPKVAPDPSLFVENIPGYVKPALNNPVPQAPVDEYAIRRIVEQMLASQQPQIPVVEPTPDEEATSTPEVIPPEPPPVEPPVTSSSTPPVVEPPASTTPPVVEPPVEPPPPPPDSTPPASPETPPTP